MHPRRDEGLGLGDVGAEMSKKHKAIDSRPGKTVAMRDLQNRALTFFIKHTNSAYSVSTSACGREYDATLNADPSHGYKTVYRARVIDIENERNAHSLDAYGNCFGESPCGRDKLAKSANKNYYHESCNVTTSYMLDKNRLTGGVSPDRAFYVYSSAITAKITQRYVEELQSEVEGVVALLPESQQKAAAMAKKKGAVLAYWCSTPDGMPANSATVPGTFKPAAPGVIHKKNGRVRATCGEGQLHATFMPSWWEGLRVWVVAMHGEVVHTPDMKKMWCMRREIIGEATALPNVRKWGDHVRV